jgi:alpha-glucosidase
VRAWWADLQQALTDVGVAGVWNDMNEPAIFGPLSTTMPDSVRHDLEGYGGGHDQAHNVYGMQMARATTKGLQKNRPDKRPVTITRSGWAGVQRHAMSWTGDNRSTWAHLKQTIPMILNLGLSGVAHTGPDIGGFSGTASGELFTRWLQMGIFLPFLRSHTFVHSPDHEPWSWLEPYLTINRRYIQLRYRLLPYLYTAFWQVTQTGLPIVRPLMLSYPEDETARSLDDQFLCGDAFLVAPVLEPGATVRSVYLPSGTWYDFWTYQVHQGPARIDVRAPLDTLPLFVRAGSVVPMGPVMSYVGEQPVEELQLLLYPGSRAARSHPTGAHTSQNTADSFLYEDDGETWAFQDGEYRLTRFTLQTKLQSHGTHPQRLELQRAVSGAYKAASLRFEIKVCADLHPPGLLAVDGKTVETLELSDTGHGFSVRTGSFSCLVAGWSVSRPQC